MSNYEYKTVALPRSVSKRRRRRQSEADLVAEQLGRVLNEEAIEGWEYVRAETLTTPGQRGLLKQPAPAVYVVLIFKRSRENVWTRPEKAAGQVEPSASVDPTPATPPLASRPEEMKIGTTSVQLVSSGDGSGSVTPMRPPLGSAQD